ncbi:MAG TPA: hypothetical protein VEO74_16910, partial [Thermoanaerobaculia bacterium]|nr:hypothetical protein [Thermoanaerobaculia bacterium]
MRSLLALGALVVSFSAYADGLRLFNPNDAAVDATVVCGNATFTPTIAPHGLDDVDGRDCRATLAAPLLVLETGALDDGVEWQRAIGPTADGCPSTIPIMVPRSGCRFGTAVVAVDGVPGASYAWSIDGGTFLDGIGTERVTIALGGGDTLKIDVAVATPGCTRTGTGVIALHDSFLIAQIDTGSGYLGQSRTIAWSYANGEPTSQTVSGTDFGPVTLPNYVRSYSYVPLTEGDKSVAVQARSGPAPAVGRQRAAGRGTAAASDCNVARATAAYRVDCTILDATIVAPAATNIESSFTARVDLAPPATAKWTIANGTPSTAAGESVVIKPIGTSPIDISVVVSAGKCSSSATKRVMVDGTFACDNPTVDVGILRNDCSGTAVQARFSGKPPFSGTWNDGQQFTTSDRAIERAVTAAGTFSVTTFRDSICAGPKSNSVTVVPNVVSAKLTAPSGACANGSSPIVATFAGTPPFAGAWSDGIAFSTSASQITRQATKGGPLWLDFHDAVCPLEQTSNTLVIYDAGVSVTIDKSSAQSCSNYVIVNADFAGGFPPYSITWLDGVTQTTPIGVTRLTRSFSVNLPSGTFGITAAHDNMCTLKVPPPITVSGKPSALFSTSGTYCAGLPATATLYSNPGAASIDWSVTNGSIISGQGTTSLRFTGTPG